MVNVDEKLEQLKENDETKGENFYGRKFRSVGSYVRDAVLVLRKAKTPTYKGGERKPVVINGKKTFKITKGKLVSPAELSNKEACEKLKEVLSQAISDLK